jgi:type IV pilus assembly protein PilW
MHRPSPIRPAPGFSLPELLVAVTIGLLILAGMTTLFINNSRAQARVEAANRQIENGRYAIDLLSNDLRNAGYYGEFDPTVLASPAGLPDPCAATPAALRAALPLHVQGVAPGAGLPSCIADVKAGTPVLVVRHARACVTDDPNCGAGDPAGPLFQASTCDNGGELGSGDPANHYALDTEATGLNRHRRDCATTAPTRRYLTHLYFVAANDRPGDGIATLKRAELRIVNGAPGFVVVPLAEGIAELHFEYGIDSNGDGTVDTYAPDPATAGGCADAACAVANWRNTLAVRLRLAATGTEAGASVRHDFQSTVLMLNPAGRKQP